jgi:hypothetical protein
MTGNKRPTLLGATLLVMVALSLAASGCEHEFDAAPATAPDTEIPLRYVFEIGDTWTYEENRLEQSTIDAVLLGETGEPVDTEDTTKDRRTFTVQDVTSDGQATLTMVYETLDRTMDGEPQDFSDLKPQEVTMTVDRTGLVTSVEAEYGSSMDSDSPGYHQSDQYAAALDAVCDITALHYPEDGTARVGEEWSITYSTSVPDIPGETTATMVGKLTAISTENGRQVAVIDYTVTTPAREETTDLSASYRETLADRWDEDEMGELVVKMLAKNELGYVGRARVDTATGRVISSEGTVTMRTDYTYTEAPEELLPLDQRGPFGWGGTATVTLVEVK